MSLPKSYDEIARKVRVYRWPGFTGMNKRVTRSGIRRFLMAAYPNTPVMGTPPWLRLWAQIDWVRRAARYDLHVTLPPELWAEDKARLAAKIAADTDIRFPEEKEKALRWTRR